MRDVINEAGDNRRDQEMEPYILHLGDCLEVLKTMPDNSVDAVVCDPPYGLSFMGRKWDYEVPDVAVWAECLRVLKPGGHLLAFAGTRTQHRMAVRIEDAGFEIRDMIAWVYGSGFPKSLDVSKAIDKAAGVRGHDSTRFNAVGQQGERTTGGDKFRSDHPDYVKPQGITDAARQWQGWGTALKPALEPITVARKPFRGTVATNVLQHGTGAINIDACRISFAGAADEAESKGKNQHATNGNGARKNSVLGDMGQNDRENYNPTGRWPANLIHDGSPEVLAQFPDSNGAGGSIPQTKVTGYGDGVVGTGHSDYFGGERTPFASGSGSAARFFYAAKANRRDRNEGLSMGGTPAVGTNATMRERENADWKARNGNHHPTVKPTDLMAYLCRLVTPPGGVVLDPFMGSGSTGKAAVREGFRFIGIEREGEYLAIAEDRIEAELERVRLMAERSPPPDPQMALFDAAAE